MLEKNFILLVVLSCFFFSCNNTFFYYPSPSTYVLPEKLELKYDENFLSGVDKNAIHTWLLEPIQKGPIKATIIHFHGNAQNMSIQYLTMIWLLHYHFEVFTFDYRGYGKSEGKVDTEKIIADSKLMIQYIQERNRRKKIPIIVWGQSLGGVLAARSLGELSDRRGIKALVIESSFHSWKEIAEVVGSKACYTIGGIGKGLTKDNYASTQYLPKFSPLPILVIHGTSDNVIPYSQGVSIFNLSKEPKTLITLLGAGHLDWQNERIFFQDRNKIQHLLTKWVSTPVSKEKPSK